MTIVKTLRYKGHQIVFDGCLWGFSVFPNLPWLWRSSLEALKREINSQSVNRPENGRTLK